MNTPQFMPMSTAAAHNSRSPRASRGRSRNRLRPMTMRATTKRRDQTTGGAGASSAPPGPSRGQYIGNRPHIAYAATPRAMPRRSELTLRRYVSRGNGRGSAASRPEQVVLVVVVDVEPEPAVERDSGGVLGRDLEVGAARSALCRPAQGRDAHRRAEPS